VPLNLFKRDLDAEGSVRKLKTWFFLARLALAAAAVVDMLVPRQATFASLFALAAALPLEKHRIPSFLFSVPSGALAALALHRTGVEGAHAAVLGLFALSVLVFLLGTLDRDLRSIR